MKLHITLPWILVCTALTHTACFGTNVFLGDHLPGRWQDVEGEHGVLEFSKEGTFSIDIPNFKEPYNRVAGNWTVLETNLVQMDYIVFMTNSVIVKVSFKDDQLFIQKDDLPPTRYMKIADDSETKAQPCIPKPLTDEPDNPDLLNPAVIED